MNILAGLSCFLRGMGHPRAALTVTNSGPAMVTAIALLPTESGQSIMWLPGEGDKAMVGCGCPPWGINAWSARAAEAVLQVLWAVKLFHPERLADVDLASQIRRFGRQSYRYALSELELAHVLQGLPAPAPLSAPQP